MTAGRALTATLFKPYVSYATGSSPEAVAIGDLNGDGRSDVALVTSFSGDAANDYMVHVFLQATDGTLAPRVRYSVGMRARSIDIGDVNGDGRADVVVGLANGSGVKIGVLPQNASGTLDPMVSYATVNSYQIKIGDFNSDGRMDIAGINWGSYDDGVDVLLQNADGTLAAPATYHAPHGGWDELEAGDINGDGRTDLIVMSGQLFAIPNVSVLLQGDGGVFGAATSYSIGPNIVTRGIAVGDANGDGRADIVASYGGNRPSSFIARFLQDGSGGFGSAASYASYDVPSATVLADMDGDGRKDVIVTHDGWARLGVYRQYPGGDYAGEELYQMGGASHFGPQALAVGDIDGDGRPDAVIADSNAGLVVLRHVNEASTVLSITAPTAGTFYTGAPLTIQWTDSADGTPLAGFDVSLSVDGGATYAPIAGCTNLPPSARACSFAPAVAGASRVRVTARDTSGQTLSVESAFNLISPTLTVAPTAAILYTGTASTISWTHNLPAGGTVHIELSRDGGGSFETLASAAPNSGSFAWIVTGPDTAAAAIRVTANGIIPASGTGAGFAITTPSIVVTGPVTGSTALVGTPQVITWTTSLPLTATAQIELSRDGGASFEVLAAAAPNSGSFAWLASGPDTALAQVRITVTSPATASGTSGPFALATPYLAVTAPAAGAVLYAGATSNITWTDNLGAVSTVTIELSRDGGASFEPLAGGLPNTGSFAWTVTGPDAAEAIVRVRASGAAPVQQVGDAFQIVVPAVTVASPVAGTNWAIGTARTITWASNLPAGTDVAVELSRDGGASWSTLAASAPATGSLSWTVTAPATAGAVVRVSANGALRATGSSGAFTIGSPALAVTAPAAGANWTIGTTQSITWTSNLLASTTVKIQVSRNGGGTFTTLASAAPNSGRYDWTITGGATTSALVKIFANGISASASSAAFSLVVGAVTVTAPNTSVTWAIGSVQNITWTHNAGTGASFKIEVSRSGVWSVIAASVTAGGPTSGTFAWTVAGPKTTNAKVRVTWNAGNGAKDTSDVAFKIN